MNPHLHKDWYRTALELVKERHAGKADKLGWPKYEHFERVADRLVRFFPDATPAQVQAALLHDALEPGESSIDALSRRGVSPDAIAILEKIKLPTDGRDYLQYIRDLVATGDVSAIQV